MKRFLSLLLGMAMLMTMVLALAGCNKNPGAAEDAASAAESVMEEATYTVDYGGDDTTCSQADKEAGVAVIMNEFNTWEGCEMHKLVYSEERSVSELEYVKSMGDYDQSMVFLSEFHSPVEAPAESTAWELDQEYTDWSWILGRKADGTWEAVTWGYG